MKALRLHGQTATSENLFDEDAPNPAAETGEALIRGYGGEDKLNAILCVEQRKKTLWENIK